MSRGKFCDNLHTATSLEFQKGMQNQKPLFKVVLKIFIAYAIFTGLIAAVFLLFYFVPKQMSKQKPAPTPTVTISPLGKFCGGIAAIQCPAGYTCKLDGNYPDAGGRCIKENVFCTQDAKQCPDGSWVGRQGPKCEFAPCPNN